MMDYNNFDGTIQPIEGLKVDVDLLVKEYNENVAPANVDRKPQPGDHIGCQKNRWVDYTDLKSKVLVQQRYEIHDVGGYMPYTDKVINQVRRYFDFTHVHYRLVMPNTCYGWHQDEMERCVHIPLITHDLCWFIMEKRDIDLPANGDVYIVNNGRWHTFVNAGLTPRNHITFMNFKL